MARSLFVFLVPAGLMACTTTQAVEEQSGPALEGTCEAEPGQQFIGQMASAELGQRLLSATGARQLRWVPPRTAVTMDFRPDRLTVEYDDDMMITRVSCG
jgi:hypothetical protein